MFENAGDLEKSIEQIETALIEGDLVRASAILEAVTSPTAIKNNRFQELVQRVRAVREDRESIKKTLVRAEHLLTNDDPDEAIPLFRKIVETSPDHPAARAGLQNARRKIEHRHRINQLIESIRRSRENEDYKSAREYCQEWLQLEPGNEQAQDILQGLDRTLGRDREVRVMINRGRELIDLERFEQAIGLLERIKDFDPGNTVGEELIAEALGRISRSDECLMAEKALDEAGRLLSRGHFEAAKRKLNMIENPSREIDTEITLLRSRIDNGLKMKETENTFFRRLMDAVGRDDIEDARVWLQMILELNPATEIIDVLQRELTPEVYGSLTC